MLYHGSNHLITGKLEPRLSFEGTKFVYATDDYYYALIRSGAFSYDILGVREEYEGIGNRFQLAEIVPGAFDRLFNCTGYIYILDETNFVYNRPNEFVSTTEIEIVERIEIKNIWNEIQDDTEHYELIKFEDTEPYWQTVRGGREGYLKRRLESVARIKAGL